MKFDCFYEVTVIKRVPESINFFEDEEIWYLGYYPYNMVLEEVKQFYEDGADAVKLKKITEKQFNNAPNPNLTNEELKEMFPKNDIKDPDYWKIGGTA